MVSGAWVSFDINLIPLEFACCGPKVHNWLSPRPLLRITSRVVSSPVEPAVTNLRIQITGHDLPLFRFGKSEMGNSICTARIRSQGLFMGHARWGFIIPLVILYVSRILDLPFFRKFDRRKHAGMMFWSKSLGIKMFGSGISATSWWAGILVDSSHWAVRILDEIWCAPGIVEAVDLLIRGLQESHKFNPINYFLFNAHPDRSLSTSERGIFCCMEENLKNWLNHHRGNVGLPELLRTGVHRKGDQRQKLLICWDNLRNGRRVCWYLDEGVV